MASNSPEQSSDGSQKRRRGAFPRAPLRNVVELVNGIYELGHGDPVRRRTVFDHLKKSPDSSASHALNAAATGGYQVTKGGKNAPYLELTERGKQLASARSHHQRIEVAYDILFDNPYFSALVEKYSERPVPNDTIAVDFLEREHGLTHEDAEVCWAVARENIFDFVLYEESGGKRVILPREHAIGNLRRGASPEAPEDRDRSQPEAASQEEVTADPVRKAPAASLGKRVLTPQVTFNIQVVLPENAPSEVYDTIFSSIATHLLGRGED